MSESDAYDLGNDFSIALVLDKHLRNSEGADYKIHLDDTDMISFEAWWEVNDG